jgi:hypothetical protein
LGVSDREAQELLGGVWLYEIADLTDIVKADVNRVKTFASRTTDRARPAYGRVVDKQPRRCTLWATTNDQLYLKSQTGNRRFLPVPVGRINIDRLRRDRDQLWGEAAAAEASGESITLDESLWATAGAEQEKRRTIDPWEDVLANIPKAMDAGGGGDNDGDSDDGGDGPRQIVWSVSGAEGAQERVASSDLLTYVLRVPVDRQTTAHSQRLAVIMERLGWQRPAGGTLRIGGESIRGYWRHCPPTAPAADPAGPAGSAGDAVAGWRPRPDKQRRKNGGRPQKIKKIVAIIDESPKGCKVAGGDGKEAWLPRSQINVVAREDGLYEVEVPIWLAKDKGMENWEPAQQAPPADDSPEGGVDDIPF